MKSGKGVPQSTIQCMGTPRSQFLAALSECLLDLGLRWMKRAFSLVSMALIAASDMVPFMISVQSMALALVLAGLSAHKQPPWIFASESVLSAAQHDGASNGP